MKYNAGPGASIELTVPAELAGLRLDQALARLLPEFSRARLTAWVRAERVTLSGAAAKPRQKVWGGEALVVETSPSPETTAFAPEALDLNVVFEDHQLVVIDKPAGLVVHPGSGHWRGTMLNALLHRYPDLNQVPRAGIVHRLDKDTSGLLVVARTVEAQIHVVRQLQRRSVGRIYQALVRGDLAREGTIDAPIGRHPVQRTRMAVVAAGRPARTHYRPLERFGVATLLECRLETGRTHQIRVHLASLGHPLVGDPLYSARAPAAAGPLCALMRQALHACRLELEHPSTGRTMCWTSTLPADLRTALQRLRGEVAA